MTAARPHLSGEAEAAGFRLLALDSTPSTNNEALACAQAGDAGRLWVVAREQTAGRGRHGRAWSSPAGNLYASLLLIDPCEPATAPQLGFVAGLALHDAVAALTRLPAPRLGLKWPNDLLLDGAKVAGILLEGHRLARGGVFAVIVGIGVNVSIAPTDTAYRATSFAEAVGPISVEALIEALSTSMASRLAGWDGGRGFADIREAWLAHASGLGREVSVRLPKREAKGLFAGMDASGRLILDAAGGRELIDAGDLFFENAPVGLAPIEETS